MVPCRFWLAGGNDQVSGWGTPGLLPSLVFWCLLAPAAPNFDRTCHNFFNFPWAVSIMADRSTAENLAFSRYPLWDYPLAVHWRMVSTVLATGLASPVI